MTDNDDADEPEFIDAEGLGMLSREAFELHSFGLVNSFEDGHPGFVSDEYLNAISAETTLPAAELEAAGLWERRDGGYLIVADDAVKFLLDHNEKVEAAERACTDRGSHRPSPNDGAWVICEDCGAVLARPDDGPVAPADGRPNPSRRRPERPPLPGL